MSLKSEIREETPQVPQVTIEDILSGLDKNTLDMVRLGKDIQKRRLPTASLGINNILDGGLPVGHQSTVWGNESSGKSAAMLQTVAINQALGVPCAYLDAEKTFDKDWAARLGVDTDKLILSQAATISEISDLQVKLIGLGVGLIVIDSTSALWPKIFTDDGEVKPFDKTGQIGAFSKDIGQMCKIVQGVNYSTAVVHISQQRNAGIGGMYVHKGPNQGHAAEHADSLRIHLSSSKSNTTAIKGKVQRGNNLVEENVGRVVSWQIDKNKINGRFGVGTYDLYTQGERVGIDKVSELVVYALEKGVVTKGGAWFKVYDEKFQGEPALKEYLRAHDDMVAQIEEDIRAQSV